MTKINSSIGENRSFHTFKSLAQGISLFVVGVGCFVLVGWWLNIPALKSIMPGWASMKSNTALLFIFSGIALWMRINQKTQRMAQACAFVVAFVGLITFGEYLFDKDFGIDEILFLDTDLGILHAGRMPPITALAFLFMGIALMLMENQARNRITESLVLAVFAICGLALVGYLYGVSSLYQMGAYSSMALHTAFSFALLSMGVVFAKPENGMIQTIFADTVGGNILRRLLPVIILGPILLGWIRL